MRVQFLDVGQGDCTLIAPPGNADLVMVDCKDGSVAWGWFDKHHTDRKLGAIVISHSDADHIAGLVEFLSNVPANRVRAPLHVYFNDNGKYVEGAAGRKGTTDQWQAILDFFRNWQAYKITQHPALEGTTVARGGEDDSSWSVKITAPSHEEHSMEVAKLNPSANAQSAVVEVSFAGIQVLVCGDAPAARIRPLGHGLKVIRAPHHGGAMDGERALNTLYSDARAELVTISVGTPSVHHPSEIHLRAVRDADSRVCCTQLDKRCQPVPSTLRQMRLSEPIWNDHDPLKARHVRKGSRAVEVPCAGTVLVRIYPDGSLYTAPERENHGLWLDRLHSPFCRVADARAAPATPAPPPQQALTELIRAH